MKEGKPMIIPDFILRAYLSSETCDEIERQQSQSPYVAVKREEALAHIPHFSKGENE